MTVAIGRRTFVAALGVAAAAPLFAPRTARAQQGGGVRRIGFLSSGAESDPYTMERLAAFREGLEQLGWSEPRNIRIEGRYSAASTERLPQLAKDLVALQPESHRRRCGRAARLRRRA